MHDKASAIFEVKTSHSLSEQLYKGIGQLLSYKHRFGNAETKLFLVVPFININKTKLILLLEDLGIYLIESKESEFFLPNGVNLNEFLYEKKIV